jgi:hypothetical protein
MNKSIASLTWRLIVAACFLCVMAISIGCSRQSTAECPNAQHYLRDYQLEYHYDTLTVYDNERFVGSHIATDSIGIEHGDFIDSLVLRDNE